MVRHTDISITGFLVWFWTGCSRWKDVKSSSEELLLFWGIIVTLELIDVLCPVIDDFVAFCLGLADEGITHRTTPFPPLVVEFGMVKALDLFLQVLLVE